MTTTTAENRNLYKNKLNTHLQSKILQSESTPETNLALEKIRRPLYEKHPMSKFAWTIAEDTDTTEWYNICQDALRKVNESYQGKETADIIQNKVLQAREEDEEIEFNCANYQLEIMRCLRELNVNNTIGWLGDSDLRGMIVICIKLLCGLEHQILEAGADIWVTSSYQISSAIGGTYFSS
ncbi:uncharacterized protein E5676_scaffold425G00030 [Cucumis melo var. makuwa]|uniref:Uncharacterized protein n=1 Tax=Cucumis melo var. makuwa TaxID=1194695 RepID=A0A5D3CAZ7_CUCMM|nr:uncharacterized protein E5676_scaffold772G00250 [Cucumis melo var. makuwa]TYK08384.1 uncharacterized protein E5676_scaffold648G002020 [Cucumis melo var. makuwa]TYK08913.1 uncharacterized protein E5676_scaffold383G00220 [Cucumis melo var. makuwa]TYK09933.1 uncharacterized protein E5676_scaffold16G00600 [Cucumis melo var. makuwa]TYK25981.1 uncharacterized protein E5676_scaffold425G00030 [Cucumis melo var. makuwa]